MEPSNVDNKIYFLGDATEIIKDILKKYSLEDKAEELTKKIFSESEEEQASLIIRGEVVLDVAINLASKKITDAEASSVLQKDLGVPQATAGELLNEIKSKLVAIATTNKPKSQLAEVEIPLIQEDKISNRKKTVDIDELTKNNVSPKRISRTKKTIDLPEMPASTSMPEKSSGPDAYREPIE